MVTRYLICGGRDFADQVLLDSALVALILHPKDAVIVHGAAHGADTMAARWGFDHGAALEAYKADWTQHGRAAGPIRNAQMLKDGRPDVVIAFPGGVGTANMVDQARRQGLVVVMVTGEGGDWYGDGGHGC